MDHDKPIYAIYGKSGFGREVMPIAIIQFGLEVEATIIFLDDTPTDEQVNGHEVWTFEEFVAHSSSKKMIAIAIADGNVRERLAQKCADSKIELVSLIAENHVRLNNCAVGEGAIFCSYTMLTSNI